MADGDDPFVSVDVSLFALDSGGSNFGRRLGISLLVVQNVLKKDTGRYEKLRRPK